MKGLELKGPANSEISHALAFFLRAIAAGVFIWLTLGAIRWW